MPNLATLLSALRVEHEDANFVYRGQTIEYNLPLVPSLFRPMITDSKSFQNTSAPVVRNVADAYFVPTLEAPEIQARISAERVADYANRLSVKDVMVATFGYPLAQILAQQAGLWSEGLDVTYSIDVAVFFATHTYDAAIDEYRFASDGMSVIYRWPTKPHGMSLEDLGNMDFYSCPQFLPAQELLATFARCSGYAEAMTHWVRFMMRKAGARLDPPGTEENHPFIELSLPEGALSSSRIARQSAALLIPDQILSKFWTSDALRNRASAEACGNGRMCVEDLAVSRGVEVYRFARQQSDIELVALKTDSVFPRHDISCLMVRDCINFLRWAARYGLEGSMSIVGDDPSNLRIIWDDFLFDGISEDRSIGQLML